MSRYKRPSLETILTNAKEARSLGDWSMVWSTENVPGMDNAVGSHSTTFRLYGRRKLRYRAMVCGSLMAMHCRVSAAATVSGFFLYVGFLILAVFGLANPMRHFEVYLGQWSISGPGRAFHIVPMLDGIGIAISIHSFVQAICFSCMASIAGVYLIHTVSDLEPPYTHCRDFNLNPYEPQMKKLNIKIFHVLPPSLSTQAHAQFLKIFQQNRRNYFENKDHISEDMNTTKQYKLKFSTCNEIYKPNVYITPPYNYFYVELMHYRKGMHLDYFNVPLLTGIVIIWFVIWLFLILEKLTNGRLVWNNIHVWFLIVPVVWSVVLVTTAVVHLIEKNIALKRIDLTPKDFFSILTDSMIIALYIHSTSMGTNLIFGKGLNHYASGHIDPLLNQENVWFSCYTLAMTLLNSSGAFICSIVDPTHSTNNGKLFSDDDSMLWILPMYSYCMRIGHYSHLLSTVIYGGLMISYMVMAYILLKAALHTVFEYRVKLVFIEQYLVAGTVLTGFLLSLMFCTNAGLPLLEFIELLNIGIAMPFICLLELIAFMYVYRAHDFLSDMNVATEENTCSTRIDTQWKIIPFVVAVCLIGKIIYACLTQMHAVIIIIALIPLICVALSVPIKACINAYTYKRRAT